MTSSTFCTGSRRPLSTSQRHRSSGRLRPAGRYAGRAHIGTGDERESFVRLEWETGVKLCTDPRLRSPHGPMIDPPEVSLRNTQRRHGTTATVRSVTAVGERYREGCNTGLPPLWPHALISAVHN